MKREIEKNVQLRKQWLSKQLMRQYLKGFFGMTAISEFIFPLKQRPRSYSLGLHYSKRFANIHG